MVNDDAALYKDKEDEYQVKEIFEEDLDHYKQKEGWDAPLGRPPDGDASLGHRRGASLGRRSFDGTSLDSRRSASLGRSSSDDVTEEMQEDLGEHIVEATQDDAGVVAESISKTTPSDTDQRHSLNQQRGWRSSGAA